MQVQNQFLTTNKALLTGKFLKPPKKNMMSKEQAELARAGADVNCCSELTTNKMKFLAGNSEIIKWPSCKLPNQKLVQFNFRGHSSY